MKNKKALKISVILLLTLLLIYGRKIYLHISCYYKTKYSMEFSTQKFETIKIGMKKDEVIKRIGEPFICLKMKNFVNENGKTVICDTALIYSEPKKIGTPYYRTIIDIKEQKVTNIINYCDCYE